MSTAGDDVATPTLQVEETAFTKPFRAKAFRKRKHHLKKTHGCLLPERTKQPDEEEDAMEEDTEEAKSKAQQVEEERKDLTEKIGNMRASGYFDEEEIQAQPNKLAKLPKPTSKAQATEGAADINFIMEHAEAQANEHEERFLKARGELEVRKTKFSCSWVLWTSSGRKTRRTTVSAWKFAGSRRRRWKRNTLQTEDRRLWPPHHRRLKESN